MTEFNILNVNLYFKGEQLKEAMTSVANYIIDSNNTVEEKEKKVPVYEHAGLHMVLRKIIGNDLILVKNNESKLYI